MAIANVQHKLGNSAGASGSQTVAVTSTTLGNMLTAHACVGGNTTMAISDNVGATWVPTLAATYDATANLTRASWVAYNIPSGITTVTVTYGASSANRSTQVAEWSGAATSAAFDQGPASQAQTSATPASLSVTPGQDNELVIGFSCSTGGNALSHGTGFTGLDGGAAGAAVETQYQIQTTATSVAAAWTCTSQYVICDVYTYATSPVSGGGLTVDEGEYAPPLPVPVDTNILIF